MYNSSSVTPNMAYNLSVPIAHDSPVTECVASASSVEQYLQIIDDNFRRISPTDPSTLWYRGQPRASFDLTPPIGREPNNPELEIVYLSKFESLAIPEVQNTPSFPIPNGTAAYWHWLFLMQHYGVPTRLMDWSLDALVGLFFAITQSAKDVGNDAAVWVLNPVRLNQAFQFYPFVRPGYIPNVDEESFNRLFGPDAPDSPDGKAAAAIGPINNPRILAQRGTFTVFPLDSIVVPLNLQVDASDYLFKICITSSSIPSIREQLIRYGITRFALFPDLCTISEEIDLEVRREGQVIPTS